MDFIEQVKDAELVVDTRPRVFLKWKNTEEGRDVNICYERIAFGDTVVYTNTNNKNSASVSYGHPFWITLESIHNSILQNDCVHPYADVYRKMDFEKCNKCGKVLCEG